MFTYITNTIGINVYYGRYSSPLRHITKRLDRMEKRDEEFRHITKRLDRMEKRDEEFRKMIGAMEQVRQGGCQPVEVKHEADEHEWQYKVSVDYNFVCIS